MAIHGIGYALRATGRTNPDDTLILNFWISGLQNSGRKPFVSFLTIQFVVMCRGSPRKQIHSFQNIASKNSDLLRVT